MRQAIKPMIVNFFVRFIIDVAKALQKSIGKAESMKLISSNFSILQIYTSVKIIKHSQIVTDDTWAEYVNILYF
jgi:hypothetical protein